MITKFGIDKHGNFWFPFEGLGGTVGIGDVCGFSSDLGFMINVKGLIFHEKDIILWI